MNSFIAASHEEGRSWLDYSGRDETALAYLESSYIRAGYCHIRPPVNGFYYWPGQHAVNHEGQFPTIHLAMRLRGHGLAQSVLKKAVLWQLLGYHYTATEQERRDPFMRYNAGDGNGFSVRSLALNDLNFNLNLTDKERSELTKVLAAAEVRASQWAARQLISIHEVLEFVRDGGGTLEQFARRYGATVQLAFERYMTMTVDNPVLAERFHRLVSRCEREAARGGEPKQYKLIG